MGSAAAYYNEHDPKATAWLRELVKRGLIAPGEVDERDIQAVQPGDLAGFTQCHFFAGIGGWSYALRLAGWADDAPVWTGSCPCQPFSSAGKGEGFADARHLWPDWFRLIRECRPHVVFGEQVASPIGLQWFDLVAADLESAGYAVGAADLPAASVGAPHIRSRLCFVADTLPAGQRSGSGGVCQSEERHHPGWCRSPRSVAYSECRSVRGKRSGQAGDAASGVQGADRERLRADALAGGEPEARPLALSDGGNTEQPARPGSGPRDTQGRRPHRRPEGPGAAGVVQDAPPTTGLQGRQQQDAGTGAEHAGWGETAGRGPVGGFWADAEWLACRDGKARPVEPGSFPLANGVPARMGRLRGYGNAICPQVAAEFIEAYVEARGLTHA